MCSVRRFRTRTGSNGDQPVLRNHCPYAEKLTTTFARIQSIAAPPNAPVGIHAMWANPYAARQVTLKFAAPFFGPSKRGPPPQCL